MRKTARSPQPRFWPQSPAVHGGIPGKLLQSLGLTTDQVLDFSVNTNPFGPSPKVLAAIREVDVTRYPDPDATELRAALSQTLDVPASQILAGKPMLGKQVMQSVGAIRAQRNANRTNNRADADPTPRDGGH